MVLSFGLIAAVVAAFSLALQALFVRVGTGDGRPNDAVVVGLVLNAVVVVPIALVLHYPNYGLTPASVLAFAGAGLIGSVAGRAFYFEGIARVGASRAEAVKASQSLLAALLAVVVVDEALSGAHLGAIALIVGGLVLLASESADDPLTGERISPRALAFPLAAAVFFGSEPVFAKVGFAEGTPAMVGVAVKVVAASVGFLAYLAYRRALPTPSGMGADFKWFVAAGLANTVFVVALYLGLAVAPVNVVVPIVQSSPLLVVGASALVLRSHEQVTPRLVAAAAIVVVGAVGVTVLG